MYTIWCGDFTSSRIGGLQNLKRQGVKLNSELLGTASLCSLTGLSRLRCDLFELLLAAGPGIFTAARSAGTGGVAVLPCTTLHLRP